MVKNFVKKLDNVIRYYFYLVLILPIVVAVYFVTRNYFISYYWSWSSSNYNLYILLLFFLSGLFFLFPHIKFKRNYFLIHFSFVIFIFLINLVLELKKNFIDEKPLSAQEILLNKGFTWDKRDRREYIDFLKQKLNFTKLSTIVKLQFFDFLNLLIFNFFFFILNYLIN